MKKCLKILIISLLLVIVPFVLVVSFFLLIKENAFSNYYSNYKYNLKSNAENTAHARYAKAKSNCYLFKSSDVTDASYRNVEYIIPESYFVIILSDVNSLVKKVQYNNKIGYVASDSVKEVDFSPVNPVLENITFDIADNVGTQLRETPTAEDASNIIMVIPAGSKSVTYVASTIGTIPTGGSSNIWYYAIYSPMSDPTSVYQGYVYSSKTVNLSTINLNEEDVEKIIASDNEDTNHGYELNNTIRIVLIIIICLPIILIFILLLLNNKKGQKREKQIMDEYTKELTTENIDTFKSTSKDKKIKSKLNKIDELDGKELKKKPFHSKFISDKQTNENEKPSFPTYEIIDDDDLL